METTDRAATLEVLRKHIEGIRFAMLTTLEEDGHLRTRPMTTQEVEFDGDLWFFASAESLRPLEVQANARASAAYSDGDRSVYVTMEGHAEVVRDRAKVRELWNPVVAAYFEGGPEDPEVALLCVHVERAEYWDAPSSKTVRLFNLLKSVVTGRRGDGGTHEKLQLTPER